MAIVANTFTKYSAVGIREDLANVIFNISNHHIDGDDLASFTAVTPTVRLGNYTQISRKDFVIADNLSGAIDEAGRRSEVAYQLAKKGDELKRDMEHNLCGLSHAAVGGSASVARKTAPLTSWLTSNTSNGSNGADPTLSGGVVNAAPTDGTQRAMTEAMLKSVVQSMYSNGGDPKFLMVGPHVKTVVSGFAGIAAQRYQAPDGPTTIIGAADVYVSDFGSISVVPNRFSRARDAYVIDPDMVEMATLRPIQSEELAKTGDAQKHMLLSEYGLQVNNEAGLGVVRDLSTS